MNQLFSRAAALTGLTLVVTLLGSGCDRQQPAGTSPRGEITASRTDSQVLADTSGEHKIFNVATPSAHGSANYTIVFSKTGTGVAYKAERNGERYVVVNGRGGKLYQEVSDMTFSPDGKRFAYVAQRDGKSFMVVDDREDIVADTVGAPLFSSDSRHLLYYAKKDSKWRLIADGKSTAANYTIYDQFFSNDGRRIISIEQADSDENSPYSLLKVMDLDLKTVKSCRLIASNRVYNADRSRMLAVSDASGKKRLIEISFDNIDSVKEGQLYDSVSYPVFGSDGVTSAYLAGRAGNRFLVQDGKETLLPDGEINEPPVVTGAKGEAAVIVASADGYDVCFATANGLKKKRYKEAAFLRFSRDGASYGHVVVNGKLQQYIVNGKPGPSYDKSLPPLFSPDGKYVICRVRSEGKRYIVVLDLEGKVLRQHPAYEMVFEPVFSSDGAAIGYGVKDGAKLVWKVEKLP